MVICPACGKARGAPLCRPCSDGLSPAVPHRLDLGNGRGIVVRPAFQHHGTARILVHRLKYGSSTRAAAPLGYAMAECLPSDAVALVPVRRALLRRVRYGVDPAAALSLEVARLTGLPVVDVLRPPLWWRSHAGADRATRRPILFGLSGPVPPHSVLIDDVLTTGATIAGAASVAQVAVSGVVATVAGRLQVMESTAVDRLRPRVRSRPSSTGGGAGGSESRSHAG